MQTPGMFVDMSPRQLTCAPPGKVVVSGTTSPERKISSLPPSGTDVFHTPLLNDVDAQLTEMVNVMTASGALLRGPFDGDNGMGQVDPVTSWPVCQIEVAVEPDVPGVRTLTGNCRVVEMVVSGSAVSVRL